MKKTSTQIVRARKLILRREALVALTPPQLTRVAGGLLDQGGDTYWHPCPPNQGQA